MHSNGIEIIRQLADLRFLNHSRQAAAHLQSSIFNL
jgi:hypothetical protein